MTRTIKKTKKNKERNRDFKKETEAEPLKSKILDEKEENFINIASHELKTPITSLKMFTQILQSMPQYEIAHKYLERMNVQLDKLTILVNDLLDVSKIQTGKLDLVKSNFALNEMILEVIELAQASTRKHKLIIKKNPHLKIMADKYRLEQVLSSLVSNAIKYSPRGGEVIINVKTSEKKAIVSIQDFGIGISKKYKEKVFNRFFRGCKETDKTYPGLGMGLFIASSIIERHNGSMWLKSKRGKGSTFYFEIPINND
ncbi:MAG: HAMP domain-containing histidine kinase [Actinobacteria bacterium]|nr:HAMP domain-containing histidine kinase [Actinomycetota bacterium]